jgi:hypothetical protein
MRFSRVLHLALLGFLAPYELGAQQGDVRVTGRVTDRSSGAALASVRLVFTAADSAVQRTWAVSSDSTGGFAVDDLPLGTYELRADALAFAELTHTLVLDERGSVDLQVAMAPAALEMEPIVVSATRLGWLEEVGFYERRARGLGYTLSREEIEARSPYAVSDLFYGIPGADVISERTGQTPAYVTLRGRCVPQVVLDGAPFSNPIPVDQILSVSELEALEVYQGSSGPIRSSTSSCGTIMLWTRRATPGQGGPLTWKRLLGAAAIVTWFAISIW